MVFDSKLTVGMSLPEKCILPYCDHDLWSHFSPQLQWICKFDEIPTSSLHHANWYVIMHMLSLFLSQTGCKQ